MNSVTEQAKQVNRRPSEAQREYGNYRKGHVRIHGMEIAIENPCGSFRTGAGPDGKAWRCRLPAHYGYLKRTEARDGDQVDVFLGPHHKSPLVYVIDQHDADHGKYDEAKVMLGFATAAQAKHTYLRAFSDGKARDRLGAMHEMTVAQFKQWLKDGDTTQPYKRAAGGRIAMADGGVPVSDPALLAQLNAPTPVTDPALLEKLNAPDTAQPSQGLSTYIPAAISDVPHEAYEATANQVRNIGQAGEDIQARRAAQLQRDTSPGASFFDPQAFMSGARDVLDVGKALISGVSAPAAPAVGAARSLIGHPMAQAEHAIGTVINPEIAAKDDPQKMYETAKGDVDLAMSAARPAGAPIKVGGAYEWQPPTPAANLKPVGVVKQPETEDFFDAATNNYSNMRGYGVEIHPNAMGQVADNIKTELLAEGYRPRNVPKVFDAIEELRTPAGQNHEISDIDSVRKVLGKARLDPSERDAARRAIGHIDDYLSNLGKNQQDVVVNPHFADRVAQEAQAARGNYAVAKRSEDIDEALEQAERQAARAGSGGNINNAIRQRLSALRNNKRKMAGWTDDEKAELDLVINGTKSANAARAAGKFAPHGIVSTVMSAGAGHVLMPGIGEIAIPAAGWIAKKVGDRLTQTAAERLQNVVKARSPLGRQTSINAAAQSATANLAPPRRFPQIARAAALPQVGTGLGQPLQRLYVGRGIQGPVPARADDKQP